MRSFQHLSGLESVLTQCLGSSLEEAMEGVGQKSGHFDRDLVSRSLLT